MKNDKNLNATNLKSALWETLNQIKDGSISPLLANSVATQSREILRVVATEIRLETTKGLSKKTKSFGA